MKIVDKQKDRCVELKELCNGEAEPLALTAEELAEAVHIIGNILRHRYSSYNPDGINKVLDRILLAIELGHVRYCLKLLVINLGIVWDSQ